MVADPAAKAKQAALRLLALRDYSEHQLRQKLATRGYDDGLIDGLLEGFRRLGYVDDDAYAARQVRQMAMEKRYGNRRIEVSLREKGLSRERIEEALGTVREELSETQALEALIRKMTGPTFVKDDKGKRRLVQRLMGRGFPPQLIYEMMERILEEDDA